ncbi:PREDICTED: uncharacterized protein LOC105555825 [Vollenhovia emeryi]|uniref:uncharacterized protein LOC105555825 n=1 Tax=Vollenhovia emeryi TaxID=411798 RepID=UPI0005F46C91|nr:PREDICTED: uncharacterized protein LOC105555825 [Vollenhovia emeryi]
MSPLSETLSPVTTVSFNNTLTDAILSPKTDVTLQSHKSSLPTLIKNVDPYVAAVLKTLAERQEEQNGKIDNVILMLNRIYRKLAPEEENVVQPKNLPTLPLNNEDAFLEIQTFLMSDDNFYPVVSILASLITNIR